MERRIFVGLAAAMALLPVAGKVLAGEAARPAAVVELFTSQGCNSCPPADDLFAELAQRSDIVALSYHVDYWDYLGWRDTLARPDNTDRQKDYMRAFAARAVYTPQAVVNGTRHLNGGDRDLMDKAIAEADSLDVGISITQSHDTVTVETTASGGPAPNAHVILVYFDPPRPVEIERGENGGRKVVYWNAVTDIQTAGLWHGRPAKFEFPTKEIAKKGGCAVLVQSVDSEGLPRRILGAAIIRKPKHKAH